MGLGNDHVSCFGIGVRLNVERHGDGSHLAESGGVWPRR